MNRKGKKIGKPVFAGFKIVFSTAMNPSTTGSAHNYTVDYIVKKKVKRKPVVKQLNVSPRYNQSNNTVRLTIIGKKPFKLGGQITINASPTNGVSSAAGVLLGGNTVFHILPNGKTITVGPASDQSHGGLEADSLPNALAQGRVLATRKPL